MAISGDFAIVGAALDDHSGLANAGSAYVFYRDQGGEDQWGFVIKLIASDAAPNDLFGLRVAISGDFAIIGAPWVGDFVGAAYIFQRDAQGDWNETDILTASDGEAGDTFGASVSISAETAIIGAYGDDDNDIGAGAAYIFGFNGQDWVEEDKLTASDGGYLDMFGRSVSISGDVAVVGARSHDAGALNSGAAYIFQLVQGQWLQITELNASDVGPNDFFGWRVAISGYVVIVGAPDNDDDGTNSGSAYVFWRDEPSGQNGWGEVAKLTASDAAEEDELGEAVAISGAIGIIGVSDDDDSGISSGSGYVFDPVCPCPWDLDGDVGVGIADLLGLLVAWGTDPGGPPDFDGNGDVGVSDLLALLANWGLCPCVEGTPPLSFEEELADACLTQENWEEFVDVISDPNASQEDKDRYKCWMTHYLDHCNKCTCVHLPECPSPDPFSST